MHPSEPQLEVFTHEASRRSGKPPLLFVHGGYCDGWCWTPHFLPWFAARGYDAHALSLRGHGGSGGHEMLFVAALDDYAADVERVAGTLHSPPVLIGHSMGAAVVERIMATRPVRGAALLAPVPPTGLISMAARLAAGNPETLVSMASMDPTRLSADVLKALRPFYFSERMPPPMLLQATRHLNAESPRALFDLSLRLHWAPPVPHNGPLMVLGADGDRISTPEDARSTARHHGIKATIVPGLAHMMMLEPGWEEVTRPVADWLEKIRD